MYVCAVSLHKLHQHNCPSENCSQMTNFASSKLKKKLLILHFGYNCPTNSIIALLIALLTVQLLSIFVQLISNDHKEQL